MRIVNWKFFELRAGAKQREPVHDEFFNNESIDDAVSAFVREVVQNILDATLDKLQPAQVRFFVSGTEKALGPAQVAPYFEGIWPHVAASMPEAARLRESACRYLVVEDFNTTGLRGDHTDFEEPGSGIVNEFFYFYRAEGKSGKSGAARGRWGIGKFVFPRASEVRAFFALTIRDDANHTRGPLLMGQAVARNHKISGKLYEPDGWWGALNGRGVPVPLQDDAIIEHFRRTWRVTRTDGTGLSVVVPYVDEDFRADELVRAVAEDYFIAVLTDELVATVEAGDGHTVKITRDSLSAIIDNVPGAKSEELQASVALVSAALTLPEGEYIRVEKQDGSPAWTPDLISIDERQRMKSRLDANEIVAVRVPVHVGRKTGQRSDSYFDVFFQPAPGHRGSAIFSREGLIVRGVRCAVSGVRAVVVVRNDDLARMLGDAEGPAHVEWTARGTKFRGMYEHGRDWLAFIKKAPAEILRIVRGDEDEEDLSLAADLFSVPSELVSRPMAQADDDENAASVGRRGGIKSPGKFRPGNDDGAQGRNRVHRRRVVVTALDDGFAVRLAGSGTGIGSLRVAAAYDVRRGDPFRKWRPEDFDLTDLPIQVTGGEITERDGKTVAVRIDDQDRFGLEVRGFDPNRDLKVQTRRGGDT